MKTFIYLISILIYILSNCDSVEASRKSRQEYEKTGHVIWDIKTNEKMVALTFDDGPNPVYTPQILDLLAHYNAKATFFVIGSEADRNTSIIKREYREGHEIALHTYHHVYNFHSNKAEFKYELKKEANTIKRITGGYNPSLYRPVAGRINDFIVQNSIKNGYTVIMWSWHQDTRDWESPGTNKIINQVISNTRPGDIIIFHDSGGDRKQTVKALKKILEFYNKTGYKCVTVSEMLFRSKSIIPQ